MNKPDDKKLYPDEQTPLLEHYSNYDSVFIGLLPFFKLKKEPYENYSSKRVISLQEAQEKDEIFKNIKDSSNMTIYASNECYPYDEEIIKAGEAITWKEIIKHTKMGQHKDVNKALMTSIGAFYKTLERQDLLADLIQYTERENIWHPTEGTFDVFTKSSIFDMFKSLEIKEIVVEDEFYENKKTIDFRYLNRTEFCNLIDFNDYYIYSKDNSILFSISWDYFFFFIAINENVFSKQIIETHFEGFWADEKCNHLWTWDEGELERLEEFKEDKV
jgi:hypothetical protein